MYRQTYILLYTIVDIVSRFQLVAWHNFLRKKKRLETLIFGGFTGLIIFFSQQTESIGVKKMSQRIRFYEYLKLQIYGYIWRCFNILTNIKILLRVVKTKTSERQYLSCLKRYIPQHFLK